MSNFWWAAKVIGKRSNDCHLFAGVSVGKRWAAGGIYSGVKKLPTRKVCFWRPLKAVTGIASNQLLHFDYVSAHHDRTWERHTQNRKTVWKGEKMLKAFFFKISESSPISCELPPSNIHVCFSNDAHRVPALIIQFRWLLHKQSHLTALHFIVSFALK